MLGCLGESYFDHKYAYAFDLILYTGACLAPSFYLHFLLTFTNTYQKRKRILFLSYSGSAFFLILNWIPALRPWFIKEVIRGFDYRSIAEPATLWYVFTGLYTACVSYCVFILWQFMQQSKAAKRNQVKYFLLAYFILVTGGTLYFSLVLDINAPPIDNFFTISYGLIMSYAILRYRLWDLRLLFREATKYLLSSGLTGLACFGAILILTGSSRIGVVVFGMCLIVPLIQSRIYEWITTLRIHSGVADPKRIERIRTLSDRIKEAGYKIFDLAETVTQISRDEFPTNQCAVLILEHDKNIFQVEGQIGLSKRIVDPIEASDPLIKYLEAHKQVLVKSEAEGFLDKDAYAQIEATFNRLEAEVIAPLIVLDRVSGLLTLGVKTDGHPYFVSDINRLNIIVTETSTALRYVLAVSRAAKETINWAHTLNQSLKPLNSGVDFLVRRASQNGMDSGLERVVPRIEKTMKKLGEFLNFLLQDSRIADEALRDKYELIPIDIDKIISEGLGSHEISIKEKRISLTKDLRDLDLTNLLGHSGDLKSVFEILISNALRYTPEDGSIQVVGKRENGNYRIEFTNEGDTIPEEHLQNIFKERFQIKNGKEGMGGLGLSNALRIIQMHKGNIFAENSQNPLGARFILEIPAVSDYVQDVKQPLKGGLANESGGV
ncbi:MAG: Adaptive-response sensory-kinase SasA [Elusimicrobia bacterium]|nr:Adaptive-response sensory-kinase SasA [Elusimicrobiota bacterium]